MYYMFLILLTKTNQLIDHWVLKKCIIYPNIILQKWDGSEFWSIEKDFKLVNFNWFIITFNLTAPQLVENYLKYVLAILIFTSLSCHYMQVTVSWIITTCILNSLFVHTTGQRFGQRSRAVHLNVHDFSPI